MFALGAALFLALIVKDTVGLPLEQYLRVVVQIGVGVYAALWLVRSWSDVRLSRYLLFFLYLAVLSATAAVSGQPVWVLLQVFSLACVFIFFIAFAEYFDDPGEARRLIFAVVGGAFAAACLAGIILYVLDPARTIDTTVDPWRYKGAFNKPGCVAAAAGLLLLFAVFERWHPLLRLGAGLVAAANLLLSGSRSSMLAAAAAILVTLLIYSPRRLLLAGAAVGAALAFVYVDAAVDLSLPPSVQKAMRLESVHTLSGRTDMWALGLEVLAGSPVLGYGFTVGSDAFSGMRYQIIDQFGTSSNMVKQGGLLDSGYMQSLMDSGILGITVYGVIILVSLFSAVRQPDRYVGAPILACLLFLAIANVGESLIFAGATPHSVFYWYLAILSARLLRSSPSPAVVASLPAAPAASRP